MFDKEKISKAIEIKDWSFILLKYVANEVDSRKIIFSEIHENVTSAVAFQNWLELNYPYLPPEILPNKKDIVEISNFFSSYLMCSFDLVEHPEAEMKALSGSWCHCELCVVLANASHVTVKKPSRYDKRIATEKRLEALELLCKEQNIQLDETVLTRIIESPEYLRDTAYLAYGKSLLERTQGFQHGVYVLSLWRQIAWKPEGSPIRGFTLHAEDFLKAERKLVAVIKQKAYFP